MKEERKREGKRLTNWMDYRTLQEYTTAYDGVLVPLVLHPFLSYWVQSEKKESWRVALVVFLWLDRLAAMAQNYTRLLESWDCQFWYFEESSSIKPPKMHAVAGGRGRSDITDLSRVLRRRRRRDAAVIFPSWRSYVAPEMSHWTQRPRIGLVAKNKIGFAPLSFLPKLKWKYGTLHPATAAAFIWCLCSFCHCRLPNRF